MKNFFKSFLSMYLGFLLGSALIASAATVLLPSLGGTGTNIKPGKGSLLVGSSSVAYGLLGTSTDGYVLTGSSTAPLGVIWAPVGGSVSYPLPYGSSTHVTITAGTGIGVSTSNGTSTITNNGVQSLTAGTGITVSTATGTPTITNIGVTSLTASSSIGLTSATGTVNIGAKNYPIQWIIENPTASENDAIFIFRSTSTVTGCNAVNKTTGDTVTFGLGYSSSRGTATSSLTNLFAAQTITATTTPTNITPTAASSTPGANNPLIFWTTAASSTQFTLSCFYNEN